MSAERPSGCLSTRLSGVFPTGEVSWGGDTEQPLPCPTRRRGDACAPGSIHLQSCSRHWGGSLLAVVRYYLSPPLICNPSYLASFINSNNDHDLFDSGRGPSQVFCHYETKFTHTFTQTLTHS